MIALYPILSFNKCCVHSMCSMEIDMQSHVKIRSKWCVPAGGGGGGAVLEEFLGGNVPLEPWNP